MKTCPDCEHDYHDNLKFCPACFAWPNKTDPFWICPKCEVEIYRSDRDSHKCDTKPDGLQHMKGDDDAVFMLARLLGDTQRVLRIASNEINRLRNNK